MSTRRLRKRREEDESAAHAVHNTEIADTLRKCIADFRDFLDCPELDKEGSLNDVKKSLWSDELGRLRIWAANIGAHQHSNASLDFRLRDASHLSGQIIDLLKELNDLLAEAKAYITGQDAASSIGSPRTDDNLSVSDASKSDYQYLYESVVLRLDNLFEMSLAVRKPAKLDRMVELKKAQWAPYRPFDEKHVTEKFPKASKKLQERLVDALSFRRGVLKQYDGRHDRYARGIAAAFGEEVETATATRSQGERSAFQPSEWRDNSDDEIEKRSSGVRSNWSMKSLLDNRRSLYVPIPANLHRRRPYECPYCHYLLDIYDQKGFVRHVFEDITPYQCIFPDCSQSRRLLASKTAWLEHLRVKHAQQWAVIATGFCVICGKSEHGEKTAEKHVARHLEELAMFALPSQNKSEDVSDEETEVADDRSSSPSDASAATPVRKDAAAQDHTGAQNAEPAYQTSPIVPIAETQTAATAARKLLACDRCRVMKIRCDADPIACQPCRQRDLNCLTTDPVSGQSRQREPSNRGESDQPPAEQVAGTQRVNASDDPRRSYRSNTPTSPRPPPAQPSSQNDPRRPRNAESQTPRNIQATAQYTVQDNVPQSQFAVYDTQVYDTAPRPYLSDTRYKGARRSGINPPSTTGIPAFQSLYATSGGPPPPNRGQRREDRYETSYGPPEKTGIDKPSYVSSNRGSTRAPTKKRRDEDDDSSSEDGESPRMPYFVPEEGIDIEPLAGYIRGLVDSTARVRLGSHPSVCTASRM